MKKLLSLSVILIMLGAVAVGCSKAPAEPKEEVKQEETKQEETKETSEAAYEDGIYFASEDAFSENSGWKDVVILEVKDGKIADVQWTGASVKAGVDKATASKDGLYKMVEFGNATAPWFEQAEKVEAYLLESQDPKAIEFSDDQGHTDAISGATISVKGFFALAEKALANGPVEKGQYKDGAYHAEEADFNAETGWKSTVDVTVINGNIMAVNWNGVHKDGGADKKTQSVEGNYKMVEFGKAMAPWFEQAAAVEAFLLEKQDTAVEYSDDEGHADAISGATIKVKDFFTLAEEALATAK